MDIEDLALHAQSSKCCRSSPKSSQNSHPGPRHLVDDFGRWQPNPAWRVEACRGLCANPCSAVASSSAAAAAASSSSASSVVASAASASDSASSHSASAASSVSLSAVDETEVAREAHDIVKWGGDDESIVPEEWPEPNYEVSNPINTLAPKPKQHPSASASTDASQPPKATGSASWDTDADDVVREDKLLDYDVVIIGAGVVGCAIARELTKHQISVAILEKGHDVAQGASKANSGIVHGGYDARHGTMKGRLAHLGNQMFTQLEEELHFGFRRCGSLVVGFSESDRKILQELIENGKKNGVENLVMLEADQVRQLEPNLSSNIVCALFCPHTGVASPYEYTIALAENAVDNGAHLLLFREVVAIERGSDLPEEHQHTGFVVRTERDNFHCKVVINAAGLNSDKVAAMVGANNFTIMPWKGEYILLNKTQGQLLGRVIFQCPDPVKGKGVLVSPTYHGNMLIGPTSRGPGGRYMTNKEVLQFLIHTGKKSVPNVDVAQAITSYAGLRAKSNTRDFIIEESKQAPGFFNVAGIDSPGLTSSAAIAKYVVNELLFKAAQRLELNMATNQLFNPFRPAIIQKKSPDFPGRVDAEDAEHNIICRCERVTEAEIVSAMGRSLVCNSVDAVKKRTRAGMGPCQGTFCEPRVVALIAKHFNVPEAEVRRAGRGTSLLAHRRVTDKDRKLLSKL